MSNLCAKLYRMRSYEYPIGCVLDEWHDGDCEVVNWNIRFKVSPKGYEEHPPVPLVNANQLTVVEENEHE